LDGVSIQTSEYWRTVHFKSIDILILSKLDSYFYESILSRTSPNAELKKIF